MGNRLARSNVRLGLTLSVRAAGMGSRRGSTVLALTLIVGSALARPGAASACTGEPLDLATIAQAAQAIVLVQVSEVGPMHAQDVPASFTLRVDRVLYGHAPPIINMTWPTPIDVCDGYIATLGDRFFMALGVGEFNPIWPIRIARPSGAERSDLPELMAALPAEPRSASADPQPVVAVALVAIGALASVAIIVRRLRTGRR